MTNLNRDEMYRINDSRNTNCSEKHILLCYNTHTHTHIAHVVSIGHYTGGPFSDCICISSASVQAIANVFSTAIIKEDIGKIMQI